MLTLKFLSWFKKSGQPLVLFDLHHLEQAQNEYFKQFRVSDNRLAKYFVKTLKQIKVTALIEYSGPNGPLYTIDLRPHFLARVQALNDYQLLVVTELESPTQSRALFEAKNGNARFVTGNSLFEFAVINQKWPVGTICPVCAKTGKVPCKRCEGSGKFTTRSGKRVPCNSEGCARGKKPCYACGGSGLYGLSLNYGQNQVRLSIPEKLNTTAKPVLFLGSRQLNYGLPNVLSKLNQLTANTSQAGKTLLEGEKEFAQLLRESTEILVAERAAKVEDRISSIQKEVGVIDKQLATLEHWRHIETLKHPVKFALCLPEKLPAFSEISLDSFFSTSIATNKPQLKAVCHALAPSCPLYFIQGPPGTGKTTVICEIILQHLKRGGGRVLVSSQSNLAVDNVLERLIERKDLKIVRLGRAEKVQSNILPYLLDELLEQEENTTSLFGFLKKIFFGFLSKKKEDKQSNAKELLFSAHVVGATCVGSDYKLLKKSHKNAAALEAPFDLLILDEAGRSTTSETLIPMKFAKRTILVGDHKQLPPVLSDSLRRIWKDLHPDIDIDQSPTAVSLFEKLINRLPANYVSILSKQFRMHPQIGDFIGKVFYADEKLENGVTAAERSLAIPGFSEALSYHSTAMFGDARFDIRPPGSTSRINKAEAELCLSLAKDIDSKVNLGGARKLSLSVITFYAAQVDLLRALFRNTLFKNFIFSAEDDISSLDAFQGKEADVVILSLVRCPKSPEAADVSWYEFFLDVRRLNVALSRARRRLLIVGDIDQLLRIKDELGISKGFKVLADMREYIENNQLASGET